MRPAPFAYSELTLTRGEVMDREAFERFVLGTGHLIRDRVDEPGEIALRGNFVEKTARLK